MGLCVGDCEEEKERESEREGVMPSGHLVQSYCRSNFQQTLVVSFSLLVSFSLN